MIREDFKLRVRSALARRNLALTRDPYMARLARSIEAFSVSGVLDVGANEGQFASQLRSSGFCGAIHSFEPQEKAFRRLRERAAKDARWTSSRLGLGSKPMVGDLSIAGNSYSSSMLPMLPEHVAAAPRSGPIGTEKITLSTVKVELEKLNWDPEATMLKVDTQGFEGEILGGAGDLVGKFPLIQVEVSYRSLYAGAPTASDLLDELADKSYEMYSIEPGISSPSSGRLLQADILLCLQSALNTGI
ncbi:MAG: FkbM family methyltransferase [Actinobacteria bacterium]|nr:FkbM family methyltransferase [Actinomycetota bacterium]